MNWPRPAILIGYTIPLWLYAGSYRLFQGRIKYIVVALILVLGLIWAFFLGLQNEPTPVLLWGAWMYAPASAFFLQLLLSSMGIHRCPRRVLLLMLLVLIGSGASFYGVRNLSRNGLVRTEVGANEMVNWIRNNTARDAVFVVAPYDSWFRQAAERAILVDVYGISTKPHELWMWWERIQALCAYEDPGVLPESVSYSVMQQRYNLIDTERATLLHERYNAKYLIVRHKSHVGDLSALKPVYRNDTFTIYLLDGLS